MNTLSKKPGKKVHSIYVCKQIAAKVIPTETDPTSATTLSTTHILNK